MTQTATTPTRQTPTRLHLPPGPKGNFFLGMMREFREDMLGLYQKVAHEYGDLATVRYMWVDTFAVNHPDHFKHILQERNRNYLRDPFITDIVKIFTGLNLFTSEGDYWLSQRRLMQPMFHRQRVANLGELMVKASQEMLTRWAALPPGQWVAIDEEMMRVTLTIVGQALFSVDLSGEAKTLGEAFTLTSEYVNHRMGAYVALPLFLPTRRNRELKQAMQTVDEVVNGIIRERRASGVDKGDLLAMLMQAKDEDTGQGLNDEQLRSEVSTMIFAGHETTATALTWALYLLSQNPAAEAKLHAELAQVLGGRAPTLADLPNLPYNRMVVEETMRLYPPAWSLGRKSLKADSFGGYTFPGNAQFTLNIYAVHRDPRWWENPEKFDPERFTPERSANRPPFAYLPFGGGPRLCIGNTFALTEAQLILATIAQRYQLRLKPNHPVRPNPIFVLRTSHGLPMQLQARG